MKAGRLTAAVIMTLAVMLILTGCFAGVPRPTVKEGRFDFSITYEINGEEKTVSGVYACRFRRIRASLEGFHRVWEGKVEKSDIKDVDRYEIASNADGVIYLDLGLDPHYFMSDFIDEVPYPYVFIVYHDDVAAEKGYFSVDPDVLASYGARIISYEYAEPIENDFE